MRRLFIAVAAVLVLVLMPTLTRAQSPAHPAFQVMVEGAGPPMILIPGLAASGETWDGVVRRYRDRYTMHVLTLAGFAGVPPIGEPLLSAVERDLISYIASAGLQRPVIVGHSLGATIALRLAVGYPNMVGSIVAVDGLPFFAGPLLSVRSVADAKPGIAAMRSYLGRLTRQQWDDFIRSGASTDDMASSPQDQATLRRWALESDRSTVINARAELYETDLREDLRNISTPVLALGTWVGVHETLEKSNVHVPREEFVATFREQFAQVKHLRFVMSDRSRHFIMFDDPEWFFSQLDGFLANPQRATAQRGFDRP